MIIVRTNHTVYGPFENANDALAWVKAARSSIPTSAMPISVEEMIDPLERVPNFKTTGQRQEILQAEILRVKSA